MSQQPSTAPNEVHLLTLKVMRLSKPGFAEQMPLLWEQDDLANSRPSLMTGYSLPSIGPAQPRRTSHNTLNKVLNPLPPSGVERHKEPSETQFVLSDMLKLPQSFGSIFLGEVFSSYVCVNNESTTNVRDVAIKSELQTSSQRFVLADSTEKPRHELHPSDLVDIVVNHEIKELGVHILVCSVHYTTHKEERKFFRKFFRFQVLNPLAVKTKVYNIKSHVYLEAQVQNVTPRMMFLESVRFEPPSLFSVTDMNGLTPGNARADRRKDSSGTFLSPQDLRQFLYKLSPIDGSRAEAKISTSIGKLDIIWKTTMGERGRLQTSQLSRKVPALEAVEVVIVSVPETVVLERPFTLTLEIRNCTAQPMRLTMAVVKAKLQSLWPVGLSSFLIGEVLPHKAVNVNLSLFPTAPGLQRLSGLIINDSISGRVSELEQVGDVLVRRLMPVN